MGLAPPSEEGSAPEAEALVRPLRGGGAYSMQSLGIDWHRRGWNFFPITGGVQVGFLGDGNEVLTQGLGPCSLLSHHTVGNTAQVFLGEEPAPKILAHRPELT